METPGRSYADPSHEALPSSMGWRLGSTFAVVALLYVNPVPQSMALSILDLATSLVDHGNVVLDEHRSVDVAMQGDRALSGMPPGASFISALVYGLAHPVFHFIPSDLTLPVLYVLCTVLVSIPAASVMVYLVYRVAVRWGAGVRNALLTAGLLAFGTMHFGYATGFYKGTLAAACLMGAFTLLTPAIGSGADISRASMVGVLCGLAIGLEYPSTLIAAVLAGYFLWLQPRWNAIAGFFTGAGLALLPVLLYHQAAFGSPWLTAYHFRINPVANSLGWPQPGPLVFLFLTLVAASPCLVWSAVGWWRALQKQERRAEMVAIATIVLGMLAFFSGWATVYPHEASFSSRLLLSVLPFAVLPMAFGLPADLKGWPLAVIGWSVGATFLATQAAMIPSSTVPLFYALKVLGTSWGTGSLFSETLAGWLNIPTLHLAVAKGTTTTSALLQLENRDLLVKVLLGQLLIKIVSLTVTVIAVYALWRYIWRPAVSVPANRCAGERLPSQGAWYEQGCCGEQDTHAACVSVAQDRHHICQGVLDHLPEPKSYGDFTRRLASRWRYRILIGALVISTLPVLLVRTSPAAIVSLVLVALVFLWDAFVRRCRLWDRYAAERELLRKILSVEAVEAFYMGARDANRMPPNVDDLSFFGGRPAAEADPVHYLRYLWLRHLLNGVLPTAGCRVLDLGCQYGLMTGLLGREGTRIVAADLNPESLKSLSSLRQRWTPVCADARTLPFRAESFDLINFTEVLEHLSDPMATLEEIKRCLRPGGTVILTTDNRHGLLWGELLNPLCVGEKIAGLFFHKTLPPPALVWNNDSLGLAFYHTNFSAHEIRALMDGAGFELARWCSYYHLGELHHVLSQFFPCWTESRIAGVLYRIDRMLNRIPVMRMLGMHWLIVGRKAGSAQSGRAYDRSAI